MLKNTASIKFENNNKIGIITVPKEFFEREAVFAVANDLLSEFFVNVMPIGENLVSLKIESKQGSDLDDKCLKNIINSLIDYQIRRDLQKEFGELRNKIVEHAFSSVSK